ncbi:hypothetical protein [Streptomyces sp. NPDC017202]|uniref:hypothetical protein n=1 Tax=Streptomyces sp. NPDC017202 TaxID=3364981 RepID=UPI0037AA1011
MADGVRERRTVADGLRTVVRALVHAVLGGTALLAVACCAADATTGKAEVHGADAPPAGTWVAVTGVRHPEGARGSEAAWPPVPDAVTVTRVRQPA